MIRTLRDSKAKLSELVHAASEGQDVLITVRGKVKARLTGVDSAQSPAKRGAWVRELMLLQKSYGKRRRRIRNEDVLAEIRQDRI